MSARLRVRTTLPAPKGLLEAEDVGVRGNDGRPILVGVSFRAQPGKIVGIVGPNGSGKSTLGRVLVGGIQPTIGTVRLDGARLTDWAESDLGRISATCRRSRHCSKARSRRISAVSRWERLPMRHARSTKL